MTRVIRQKNTVAPYYSRLFISMTLLVYGLSLWPGTAENMWDLPVYYHAGQQFIEAIGEKSTTPVVSLYRQPGGMPFLYHPLTLPLFGVLASLPPQIAKSVFFMASLLALIGGIFLWLCMLGPATASVLAVWTLCAPAAIALLSGNICCMLWLVTTSGIYLFFTRRIFLSCVCLATLLFFKLTTAFFLILPLTYLLRRNTFSAFAAVTATSAIFIFPAFFSPELFQAYTERVTSLPPSMHRNFAPLFLSVYIMPAGFSPQAYLWVTVLAYMAAVCFWFSIRKISNAGPRERILSALALYLLSTPHLQDYSFFYVLPLLHELTVFRSRYLALGLIPAGTAFAGMILSTSSSLPSNINRISIALTGGIYLYLFLSNSLEGTADEKQPAIHTVAGTME